RELPKNEAGSLAPGVATGVFATRQPNDAHGCRYDQAPQCGYACKTRPMPSPGHYAHKIASPPHNGHEKAPGETAGRTQLPTMKAPGRLARPTASLQPPNPPYPELPGCTAEHAAANVLSGPGSTNKTNIPSSPPENE